METPKIKETPEDFFFETVRVAQVSATANEKAKFVTIFPSQPHRSAVVTAFITCPDIVAVEVGAAINKAVDEVFARHGTKADMH